MAIREKLPVNIYALCEPNQPSNIRYIGKVTQRKGESMQRSLNRRKTQHIIEARNTKGKATHRINWLRGLLKKGLQPEIILIDVGDENSWADLEIFYIASHRSAGFRLTNCANGGEGAPGIKLTPEHKTKLRNSRKGKKLTPQHKAKISTALKGRKHRPEVVATRRQREVSVVTRLKLSVAGKGRKHTEASKKKMSMVQKGRIVSPEQRAKISTTQKGKKLSEEHRKNISRGLKGRTLSPESKAKISASNAGRKHTPESRAKMSAAHKGRVLSPETRAKLATIRTGWTHTPESKAKMRESRLKRTNGCNS